MRSLRVLGVPVLLAVAGCAAAGGGSTQQLTVETDPAGATCRLVRLGQSVGEVRSTPGVVVVERTKTDIEVICGKDDYDEARFINKSEFNSATVGSILLGGAIGLAADAASGAINKYDEKVVLNLVPRPAGSGTASVSPSPTPFSPSAQEIALWESIRNSDEADDYAFYLKRFPNSPRAPQAQARLNALRIPPPVAPVVAMVVVPPPAVSQTAPQAVAGVPSVPLPPPSPAAPLEPAPPTPNLADQREAARNSAPVPLGSVSSGEPVSAAVPPTPDKPVAPATSAALPNPLEKGSALRDGSLAWSAFDGTIDFGARDGWRVAVSKSARLANWLITYNGYPLDCRPSQIDEDGAFSKTTCRGSVGNIELSLELTGTLAALRGLCLTSGYYSQRIDFPNLSRADITSARRDTTSL